MENIYQALGRGFRQTAGDLESAQTQMDKGQEIRLTLDKMIQERAYALERQRQLEMENELKQWENQRAQDSAKRQDEHRQQIRMQREKAQQQSQIEAQKHAQAQAMAAQEQQFGPQQETPRGQAPNMLRPNAPAPMPARGPMDQFNDMSDDLYGADAITGDQWLDARTKYAKATGALQDPEMAQLKRESERARALAAKALADLRNRTDPNRRAGGRGSVDAGALAQVLAADDAEIQSLEEQLQMLGSAPSQYSSEAMGWKANKMALETQLRAAQARMIRNAMKATSPDILPPSMGGDGRGARPIPSKGKKYKYTPQGLVPKG